MTKSLLYKHQLDTLKNMRNGCILNGGVGSGKSRTAIAYYVKENGGSVENKFEPIAPGSKDLYIITTAKKRDSIEWQEDLSPFLLSVNEKQYKRYGNNIYIDSWNNIKKYKNVKGAFFIFDEQRVVGSGIWVKSFIKIAKNNKWILLTATPGDTWTDYIPVFIANGFYENRTEFSREHCVYSRFTKYPKIDRFINTGKLRRLRDKILIDMDFERKTIPHHEDIYCTYDKTKFLNTIRLRWNPYKNEPIEQAAELCYILRRIVNEDNSRVIALMELLEKTPKAIIFYNFDYELDILKNLHLDVGLDEEIEIAEWNGHKHQPIPTSKRWLYLVQYTAGAEGWNCTTTDTIIFYSQNYSYKTLIQACGRIDRLNTPYINLYYYHLKSRSGIDLAISKALYNKKKFNENNFVKW
jgi:hypothetical protein